MTDFLILNNFTKYVDINYNYRLTCKSY